MFKQVLKIFVHSCLGLGVILILSASSSAQKDRGSIVGTVSDASLAMWPGGM